MALDPDLKMVFEKLEKDIGVVAEVQIAHGKKLDATFEAVGDLQEDMVDVKGQLGLIRGELQAKADRSEVRLLEERVIRLERRMLTA